MEDEKLKKLQVAFGQLLDEKWMQSSQETKNLFL